MKSMLELIPKKHHRIRHATPGIHPPVFGDSSKKHFHGRRS
jgi:hypothetical protein